MFDFPGKTTEIDYTEDVKIDLKAKKILSVLSRNCRLKLTPTQIGNIVGLSKEVIHHRIKNLENNGLIRGYYTAVNLRKIGLQVYIVFLELQNISQSRETKLVNKLIKHPATHYITYCLGKYDIVFDIIAKSIDDFDEILRNIFQEFGRYIKSYETTTILDVLKYVSLVESFSRNLDLKKEKLINVSPFIKDLTNLKIDYKETKINLDEKDFQILGLLANNATLQLKQLAEKINLSSDAIKYRIKGLVKQNVILGFYPIINMSMLGYHNYGILLELNNTTFEEKEKILNNLAFHPDVVFCLKTSSHYEIILNVAVKNNLHLYKLINDLKEKFPRQIKKIETFLIIKDHKIAFLPSL